MTQTALAMKNNSSKPAIKIQRHHLKPALAEAARNLEHGSQSLKRHRHFLEDQNADDLQSLRAERDQTQVKYDALKSTVDQLVHRIQDMASLPAKAQAGDISNIRTLLKQAYLAMERQQLELRGIRARTQRIERMSIEQDQTNRDVRNLMQEFNGYQKSLYVIRKDMADLVEIVEGETGLKELQSEVDDMRHDMITTLKRTDLLEEKTIQTDRHTRLLAKRLKALEETVHNNAEETEGLSGALSALKEEVSTLNKKFFNYVLEQMRFSRKPSDEIQTR